MSCVSASPRFLRHAKAESVRLIFILLTPVLYAQAVPSTRIADLQHATSLISAHRGAEAQQLLTKILALDPHEARAIELMGVLDAQQGNLQDAEKQFRDALGIDPTLTAAHVNLGFLLVQTSRPEAALNQFEQALEEEPTNAGARTALVQDATQLALAARNAGNMGQALGFLIRARHSAPDDPTVLYDFSVLALQMNLRDDALAAVNQLLKIKPDDARALYARSRIQLARQHLPQAKADMLRYIALNPNDASAYYGLGKISFTQMDLQEAEADFERSIKMQPNQTESYSMLGQTYLKEDRLDKAKSAFDATLKQNPSHASSLAGEGIVSYRQKEYPTAAMYLRKAIASDSDLQIAHYYYGLTLARLGKNTESQQELNLAGQMADKQNLEDRTKLQLRNSENSQSPR